MPGEIRVEGLADLQSTFRRLSDELAKELQVALRELAEPVRAAAETLADERVSHIGPRWSRMRIGTAGSVVYVAPKSRRRRGTPRKNLAGLLMDKAMEPALAQKEPEIVAGVDSLIDRLIVSLDKHGF